ncbi:hypothetical protein JKP88DRAFT_254944 [Tribonema minus]|uniref:Uncharacterized protein n=1 Tax=Tribonema minus TaxID=303371 RepID=A0A836CGX0_9STRA|nr:hypothetical protein JKP88DRAFT_254944 [Tribonema minus]
MMLHASIDHAKRRKLRTLSRRVQAIALNTAEGRTDQLEGVLKTPVKGTMSSTSGAKYRCLAYMLQLEITDQNFSPAEAMDSVLQVVRCLHMTNQAEPVMGSMKIAVKLNLANGQTRGSSFNHFKAAVEALVQADLHARVSLVKPEASSAITLRNDGDIYFAPPMPVLRPMVPPAGAPVTAGAMVPLDISHYTDMSSVQLDPHLMAMFMESQGQRFIRDRIASTGARWSGMILRVDFAPMWFGMPEKHQFAGGPHATHMDWSNPMWSSFPPGHDMCQRIRDAAFVSAAVQAASVVMLRTDYQAPTHARTVEQERVQTWDPLCEFYLYVKTAKDPTRAQAFSFVTNLCRFIATPRGFSLFPYAKVDHIHPEVHTNQIMNRNLTIVTKDGQLTMWPFATDFGVPMSAFQCGRFDPLNSRLVHYFVEAAADHIAEALRCSSAGDRSALLEAVSDMAHSSSAAASMFMALDRAVAKGRRHGSDHKAHHPAHVRRELQRRRQEETELRSSNAKLRDEIEGLRDVKDTLERQKKELNERQAALDKEEQRISFEEGDLERRRERLSDMLPRLLQGLDGEDIGDGPGRFGKILIELRQHGVFCCVVTDDFDEADAVQEAAHKYKTRKLALQQMLFAAEADARDMYERLQSAFSRMMMRGGLRDFLDQIKLIADGLGYTV